MRFLQLMLLLIVLIVPVCAHGVDSSGPETQITRFFEMLATGKIDEAFAQLVEGSSLAKTDPLGVNQVPSNIAAFMKVAGPMLGHERLISCALGSRSVKLVYLQNLKLRPLTWVFYYYNNGDGWTLTYLEWNGQYTGIEMCP